MKGIVYLLYSLDEDTYKIGITSNSVKKRIKELQTGNSSEIKELYAYESDNYVKLERLLHFYFSNQHKRGEWFKLEDEQWLNFLKKCKEFDETITLLKKENYWYQKKK